MRLGGSKIRPTSSTWSNAPLGLTVSAGGNCDERPPSLRASNSPAFVFITSASPCSFPSKSAGPLLLSRRFCPDGKKSPRREGRTIIFVDEAGFYLLPLLVRTYAPVGQTPILRVPLTRDHLSVIGGLTPDGRMFMQMQEQAYRAERVITFLPLLLRKIPGKLLVVLD